MTFYRSRGTFRVLLMFASVVLLMLASSLMATGTALAGQYVIHNCLASLEPNLDAGPWQSFNPSSLGGVSYQGTCTPGSTLGAAIGWYADEQALNSNLGVALQSPVQGLTIRAVRVVWSVAHESSGSDTFAQVVSDTGISLIYPTPLAVGTSNPTEVSFPASTHTAYIYSYCSYDNSTNCYFPSSLSPIIRIEGLDTTLEDNDPPSAIITGGSLAGGGPVSGTATLQFTATDGETGVRESQLLVDGGPVVTHSYASQCSYTTFVACPASQTDSLSLATAKISNGQHQVALRITDAAGNTQIVGSHVILVANIPMSEGPPNGSGGSSEGGPPPGSPSPCAATPGANATISVTAKHHIIESSFGERVRLSGKLLESGEKPIAHATIEVLAQPIFGSETFSPLGHAVTRARGHFSVVLPSGISRTLCLRYRPTPQGGSRAVLVIAQRVRAGMRLGVYPHAIESNGTVFLSGKVLGGFIPSIGKVVELQVHYLGSWRVFRTPRASTSGAFTSFYSFLGGQGTFAFRACVRSENDYPFIFGCSHPVFVRAG